MQALNFESSKWPRESILDVISDGGGNSGKKGLMEGAAAALGGFIAATLIGFTGWLALGICAFSGLGYLILKRIARSFSRSG